MCSALKKEADPRLCTSPKTTVNPTVPWDLCDLRHRRHRAHFASAQLAELFRARGRVHRLQLQPVPELLRPRAGGLGAAPVPGRHRLRRVRQLRHHVGPSLRGDICLRSVPPPYTLCGVCSTLQQWPCSSDAHWCLQSDVMHDQPHVIRLLNDDNQTASAPRFKRVGRSSIVMAPHDKTDDRGVQDPRVAFDPRTGIYYMFYTCFNTVSPPPAPLLPPPPPPPPFPLNPRKGVALCSASRRQHCVYADMCMIFPPILHQNHAEPEASRAVLCLATSRDPTSATGWIKRSVVFPGR